MEIVVSGIRSTGQLHLGNYFGAVKNFVRMQHEHNCYFFIADYHALTTHPNPQELRASVRQVLVEYLACGINPEVATVYLQSDLREIPELYMLLNMHAYVGELEKVPTFKDKVRKQPNNVNAGLLTYPVLMTADVIIHKATKVPVGKDQEQHLEMARNFVNRFNHFYGIDYFPEPYPFNFGEALIKVPGLDGSGKMGKSEGNAIYLSEDPAAIRKKIMRAVTDSGPTEANSTPTEAVENLFTLLSLVSTSEVVAHYRQAYADCSIRYGDLKKQLAEDVLQFVAPIREKIDAISADEAYIQKVMREGAEKARESAAVTLREVRAIMGF
ncbi:MAG: tryptophan--tRNA ligase [Bacteroidia bacterium]